VTKWNSESLFLFLFDGTEIACQELGCALTFALEAKFEIEVKIWFRLGAEKKPDFT
jgi:hypothetical protein